VFNDCFIKHEAYYGITFSKTIIKHRNLFSKYEKLLSFTIYRPIIVQSFLASFSSNGQIDVISHPLITCA